MVKHITIENLELKKKQIDAKRPLAQNLVENLEKWFALELNYTSNALEGNTLTRKETSVILEKGITIGGKTLREHLEIINHENALQFLSTLINQKNLTEAQLLQIHSIILSGIDNPNAGRYRDVSVRISGSSTILPSPRKVPHLMEHFFNNTINHDNHPVIKAALAHYELVTIHPFIDGNGRSARLLMNLILMQNGYPPAIIRTSDRMRYLSLLEQAQTQELLEPFLKFIYNCVARSLDIYLKAIEGQIVGMNFSQKPKNYLRIGEIAKITQESVPTIRFWTQNGLLNSIGATNAGYAIYSPQAVEVVKKIRHLQKSQKMSLEEIKAYMMKSVP